MLLKERYTESYMGFLESKGYIVLHTNYRIDLANFYSRSGVKIDERISIDPNTMVPWFAYYCYSNLSQEKRPRVLKAIDDAFEKTNGVIFRNSSDSEPTIKVNILFKQGKPNEKVVTKAIEHLMRLEKIIQDD